MSRADLVLEALTPARLPDLRRVLEPVCGGDDGCYCFNHHIPSGAPDITGPAAWEGKVAATSDGRARGVLAYLAGDPVGWLALDAMCHVPGHDCVAGEAAQAWTVHCFVVVPEARGQGVADAMLAAAVAQARAARASELLAYPAPGEPELAFAGSPGLFTRAGFTPEGDAPAPYQRWRLALA